MAIQGTLVADKKKDASREMVKIEIHKSPLPKAVDPVPISINGRQWTIKRGVTVEVPKYIAHILENAVETRYQQIMNPDGSTVLEPRDSLSYPFSYK